MKEKKKQNLHNTERVLEERLSKVLKLLESSDSISSFGKDISYIKDTIKKMDERLEKNYVTKEELARVKDRLNLIQIIVFTAAGIILSAFFYSWVQQSLK